MKYGRQLQANLDRLDQVEAKSDVNSNTGRFVERFMWIIVASAIGLIVYFMRI